MCGELGKFRQWTVVGRYEYEVNQLEAYKMPCQYEHGAFTAELEKAFKRRVLHLFAQNQQPDGSGYGSNISYYYCPLKFF